MIGCFVMALLSAFVAANGKKNVGYLQSGKIFLKSMTSRLLGGR
jgi:hypothetical protein